MPTIILTKSQLISFNPCDLEQRLNMFGGNTSLDVREALKVGFTVSDILWIAGRMKLGSQIVEFANGCAARSKKYRADAYAYADADATAYAYADADAYARAAADATAYAYVYSDAAARADAAAAEIKLQKKSLIEIFG